ncbi:alpha/beta hydrolase [Pseudomonas oryzihabitans]|nr:alpha/beta hydrolase [Pseudomonas psychrotolerans]
MKRYGLALLLGACLSLVGCTSPQQRLTNLAASSDLHVASLGNPALPVLGLVPARPQADGRMRIYLEGDGHAWATATQPSLDPSPHNLLVPRLALNDPGYVAYLGRPCQYVKGPGCTTAIWTSARFGSAVIASLQAALDELKRRYGVRQFELVGYSGGAAIALLLAERRQDVVAVQTLAGNLDPYAWTAMQQLQPLSESLDPLAQPEALRAIPQRHLVGHLDNVVPAALADGYRRKVGGDCVQLVEVDADHAQGWEQAWQRWRGQPLPCTSGVLR